MCIRDSYYGRTVSCFMDEFIGYDLSHEQVRDAKECRLRKAREDYDEANAYTPQELSDMLNGRRLIKACDIPRIAKALGVEINYLFGIEKGA